MTSGAFNLVDALLTAPALPGARCTGKAHLFDPQDIDAGERRSETDERHRMAKALCGLCPAYQDCFAWATTLIDGEVSGVLAGVARKPPTKSITVPEKRRSAA